MTNLLTAWPDGELLTRFVSAGSEEAFAEIIRRYGGLVHDICRRSVDDQGDRDDAWQATFFLLARKAHTIHNPAALASWLHGAARRVCAHARRGRRRGRPLPLFRPPATDRLADAAVLAEARDAGAALEEELALLPARYRSVLILACLNGLSKGDIMDRLGLTEPLVTGRLARGKALLRDRLTRRGLAPAVAAGLLSGSASVQAWPRALAQATAVAASALARGVPGPLPAAPAELLRRTLVTAALGRFKRVGVGALTVLGVTFGCVWFLVPSAAREDASPTSVASSPIATRGQRPEETPVETPEPLPEGALTRLGTERFRQSGDINSVAFSRDGKYVASASNGRNSLVIWERTTGLRVRDINNPRGQRTKLSFSPDGTRLFDSGWDGKQGLCCWEVATGKRIDVPDTPFQAEPVAYSPDGRELVLRLFKTRNDWFLIRWDLEKGDEIARHPYPAGGLCAVGWQGDKLLGFCFKDKSLAASDVAKRERLWSVPASHPTNGGTIPVVASNDGKFLATETSRGVIALIDVVNGKEIRQLRHDEIKGYYGLYLSPDGKTVAANSEDGAIHLWDVGTGERRAVIAGVQREVQMFVPRPGLPQPGDPPNRRAEFVGRETRGIPRQVFFSPDSQTLTASGATQVAAVQFWEAATGKPVHAYAGHRSVIGTLAFTPDSRTAATTARLREDPIWVWDVATGRSRGIIPANSGGYLTVGCAPDGDTFVTCTVVASSTRLQYWSASTGESRIGGHVNQLVAMCLAYSPDGQRLALGGASYAGPGMGGGVCVCDARTGKVLAEHRGLRGPVMKVAFSPDGRQVLAAAQGVYRFDLETGTIVDEPLQPANRVSSLSLSRDGRLLATAPGERVALWELATHREIFLGLPAPRPGHVDSQPSHAVALSPDARTLAVGVGENVRLLHWPTNEVVRELKGQDGIVSLLAFTPDGRRLASAGNNATSALLWDVPAGVKKPLAAGPEPSADEFRGVWVDLKDSNATTGYKAVWRFVAHPSHTLPMLTKELQPARPADPALVSQLIAKLGSENAEERKAAFRALAPCDDMVVTALQVAKKAGVEGEQLQTINRLLTMRQGLITDGEQLRLHRAVAILEHIGGAEARQVLQPLTAGAPGALLTREAQAALNRLNRPKSTR
jgi:RNA polymerase sigma factor (sigma-70 family)